MKASILALHTPAPPGWRAKRPWRSRRPRHAAHIQLERRCFPAKGFECRYPLCGGWGNALCLCHCYNLVLLSHDVLLWREMMIDTVGAERRCGFVDEGVSAPPIPWCYRY